jgi:hypothetical protein
LQSPKISSGVSLIPAWIRLLSFTPSMPTHWASSDEQVSSCSSSGTLKVPELM